MNRRLSISLSLSDKGCKAFHSFITSSILFIYALFARNYIKRFMTSTFVERKVIKFSSNNSNIMHKKVYSDNLLWYYSLFLCYRKTILRIMKTILLIVGLETGYAERSREGQEKVRVYEPMSGQDKPVISDGFEVQTIHSQPV